MDRRRDPDTGERNTQEDIDRLIEEKYREIERLEAQARRSRPEQGYYEGERRSRTAGESRPRRPRPEEGYRDEEMRPRRPRPEEGYREGEMRPRRPRPEEGYRDGEMRSRRPRPEREYRQGERRSRVSEEQRRSRTAGTEGGSRPRRPRPEQEYRQEERRREPSRISQPDHYEEAPVKVPQKEKTFLSEKIIKKVGGLIGVIIALLVVLVVFGGDFISGFLGTTKLASSKGVINILLVGQDGREDVEGSRSDSMMLVSVNKDTDQVKIISLMRDMYVSIPGHEDNRINASYSMGGIDLLTKTVEENFQVKIDGNVQIDFESFKTVIDDIGGVEIELSQAEADYLNLAYWQNGWTLTAGVQTLNGEQALAYSRVRQVGNSDFERTERQRTVLMTAFNKVKTQGKIKMLSLAKDIYPMLDTDIGLKDMTNLGLTALSLSEGSIETYRLPIDGGFENQTIRNMAVLVPNLEMNQNYLKELLYGTTTE